MRPFFVACVLLVVLIALSPIATVAKGPSGGGSGGGSAGGGWGPGKPGNWLNSGQPGYGYGYGWRSDYYQPYDQSYVQPYVVQRPIVNPMPETAFSGLPIKIVNPAGSKATLNYTLNGSSYSIPPGFSQDLQQDRPWVIEFSRGASFGQGRYGLQPGLFTFSMTDHGWELYHNSPTVTPTAPANPPAPMPTQSVPAQAVPTNPAPNP